MAVGLVLNRTRQVPAEDTPAFGGIAERFRRAGDLDRAVALCREGLKKFPDHLSARVTLGWSLLDLGKYDEARAELEKALKRAPDNLAAIRGLAELHDRAEHTMMLPMDGPGAWPPDAAAIDAAAASEAIELDLPADLPLDLALPAPLAPAEAAISAASALIHPATPIAPTPELTIESPILVTEAAYAASATMVSATPVFTAVVAPPEPAAVPALGTAPVDAPVFEESADVQLVLAETDTLNLDQFVSELAIAEEPVLELPAVELSAASDPDIEGSAADPIDLEALIAEANSLESAAEESLPAMVSLETPAVELESAVVALEEPVVVLEEPVIALAEPVVEPEPAIAAFALTSPTAEDFSLAEDLEAELGVMDLGAAIASDGAISDRPLLSAFVPESEWLDLDHIEPEELEEEEAEPAEIAAMTQTPDKDLRLPLAALESFLRRVELRRLDLMAQSVA